jgi:copper chaperone NosL
MAPGAGARGLTALGFVLVAAACGTSRPRPLAYGTEVCAHCHMTLADARFSAELLTEAGKVIPFDDVGCLAAIVAGPAGSVPPIQSLWVSGFVAPHTLLDARTARFLRSDAIRTPMDYHLAALRNGREADSVRAALGGELLSWDQVVRMVGSRSAP